MVQTAAQQPIRPSSTGSHTAHPCTPPPLITPPHYCPCPQREAQAATPCISQAAGKPQQRPARPPFLGERKWTTAYFWAIRYFHDKHSWLAPARVTLHVPLGVRCVVAHVDVRRTGVQRRLQYGIVGRALEGAGGVDHQGGARGAQERLGGWQQRGWPVVGGRPQEAGACVCPHGIRR